MRPFLVLPQTYAERMAASKRSYGRFDAKWSATETLAVVDGFREGRDGGGLRGYAALPKDHHLGALSTTPSFGVWYRVKPEAHLIGVEFAHRGGGMTLDAFRDYVVPDSWIGLAHKGMTLAVTVTEPSDDEVPPFLAWKLSEELGFATLCPIDVVPDGFDLLDPIRRDWPVGELAGKRALMIGAGSIGSFATERLVSYGLRKMILVDPDRLHSHNFARHACDPRELGRFKVDSLADRLSGRDPQCDIEPLAIDVIDDADLVRALLLEVDIAVVTTDGVDSRRSANHLIRAAGKPAVFACVLENGAFGEILRIRPPTTGCLLCARAELRDRGGMDPEPNLDRGYGTGTRHLPMTAAPGDLTIIGDLAAKAAVGTLLEASGFREQRLPADHVIIGLQPKPDMAEPFDLESAGEVKWRELPAPREDCPTCGACGHGS
jgi:molybdopterin/thiamine biosynthesis adenylyltransferase